jgi:hypothetical protein
MIIIKGQNRTSDELNRYALIKEYYVKNESREEFNLSYLTKITNRLFDISLSINNSKYQRVSKEDKKTSEKLFEFFAHVSKM